MVAKIFTALMQDLICKMLVWWEGVNIENYSLYPPQSRSSSAPSNFHSSFFSTFIQSQPNYVVPAAQNVHFLFLNVCGLKINYVNMNLFREKILILPATQRQWLACFYKAVFSGGGLALCLHPEMGILVWKPLRLGSVFSVPCHDKGWELL